MLFRKTTAAVLAATLILNGCTMMLRGMNNPVSQTITRKHVDKDQIRAFGVGGGGGGGVGGGGGGGGGG
ncbi:hypothetical protein PPO91_10985, partial [Neisseria gonorrhoeae]